MTRALWVFGILVGVGAAWLAFYWIVGSQDSHRRLMRSRATELYAVAGLCKTAVAEYYAAKKRMPANEKDAGCEKGTGNVAAPRVAHGVVTTVAQGKLAQGFIDERSGTSFTYTPTCNGPCDGSPIAAWDCKTATTIERAFLPAACR